MSTRTALDRVLAFDGARGGVGWLVVAVSIHVGLAGLLARRAVAAPSEPPITEVELAPPPEVAPPPEPPPPPPEPTKEIAPTPSLPTVAAAPRAAPTPPPAAKAGALVAAKDDAPAQHDDAVSFVTDPNGGSYGSGVVAKGGTADVGAKGATAAPTVATTGTAIAHPAPAPTLTPAANLSHPPRLEVSDPCKGYFPTGADEDHGSVAVQVVVRPDGTVASASIVQELPKNQGFAAAARACLLATRFAPALDLSGAKTTATATVKVRFSR